MNKILTNKLNNDLIKIIQNYNIKNINIKNIHRELFIRTCWITYYIDQIIYGSIANVKSIVNNVKIYDWYIIQRYRN